MKLNENDQAIVLLTARFPGSAKGAPTPLTNLEYGRLSQWLLQNQMKPSDFLGDASSICDKWEDPKEKITKERILYLLGRGASMGVALDQWNNAGIWIVTRAGAQYPARLKKKLGKDAPPLIFGIGDVELLSQGGLAVVGSRHINKTDETYAYQTGGNAAKEGESIVSGGARGVDETAMLGALEAEGTAVGILSNGLLQAALAKKWRQYLRNKQLCLISMVHPEATFNVGNAMGRNKYIYSLADRCVVVRSDKGKGGTWAGAVEALNKDLAPVYVKEDSDAEGNAALLKIGALPASGVGVKNNLKSEAPEKPSPDSGSENKDPVEKDSSEITFFTEKLQESDIFYSLFVEKLYVRLNDRFEATLKELKETHTDISQKQITDWLTRATEEKLIERPSKAHRYILPASQNKQTELF